MKKKSIIPYIFLVLLLIILPLNVISIFSSNMLMRNLREQSRNESRQFLSSVISQIDHTFAFVSDKFYSLTNSSDFLMLSQQDSDYSLHGQYQTLKIQCDLFNEYRSWLSENDLIDGYFFYNTQNHTIIYQTQNNSGAADKTIRMDETSWLEPGRLGKWNFRLSDGRPGFYYIQKEHNSYYGAWVILPILEEKLGIHADGKYQLTASSHDITSGCIYAKSTVADLYMLQPSMAGSRLEQTILLTAVLSAITLLAFPALWVILYKQIFIPVKRLQTAILNMEHGQLDYKIDVASASNNEFDQLNRSFNHVMEMLKDLKTESYELQIAQREIEIKYLTQQIQPHFILNTLNILYCYDRQQYPQIQEIILYLSKYFRYVVHAPYPFVPLYQEINHLENYLKIQNIRYADNIKINIAFDAGLKYMKVPPLAIQNFVENSIKYAISPDQPTYINVRIYTVDDKNAMIQITDSGPGFHPDKLNAIQLFLKNRMPQPDLGVGICNTIQRLELLYGSKASVRFYNQKPSGAGIDLLVPIELTEPLNNDFTEEYL